MTPGNRTLKRTNTRAIMIEMINTDLLFVAVIGCLLVIISKYHAKHSNLRFPLNWARLNEKSIDFSCKRGYP
jgi:hypothetical protein